MSNKNSNRGPSQRQLRVGELLRRSVTDLLLRGDLFDPDLVGASVTVTEARPTPDMRQAVLYVSVLGSNKEDKVVAALQRNAKQIKREALAGMTLRFTPDLKFELDTVYDRLDETHRMFSDPKVKQDLQRDSEE